MKAVEKAAFLYSKGLTVEEIAEVLDVSKKYARWLLWQARRMGLLAEPRGGPEARRPPPQAGTPTAGADVPAREPCADVLARLEALVAKLEALAARIEAAGSREASLFDNEWVRLLRARGQDKT
ncbi:MAG: hypothetical protein QXP98_00990 [Thermoproteus sp.]